MAGGGEPPDGHHSHDGEEGQGQHGEGDVSMPGGPDAWGAERHPDTPGDHPARNAMDDFAELDALN